MSKRRRDADKGRADTRGQSGSDPAPKTQAEIERRLQAERDEWDNNPLVEDASNPHEARNPGESRPTFVRSAFESFTRQAILDELRVHFDRSRIPELLVQAKYAHTHIAEYLRRSSRFSESQVAEFCDDVRARVKRCRSRAEVRPGEPGPEAFPDPEFDPCFLPEAFASAFLMPSVPLWQSEERPTTFRSALKSFTRQAILVELARRYGREKARDIVMAAKLQRTSFAEHLLATGVLGEDELSELCRSVRRQTSQARREASLARGEPGPEAFPDPEFDPCFLPDLTIPAETCHEEGLATEEGTGAITDAPAAIETHLAPSEEFATASLGELVEAYAPAAPGAVIARIATLIREAQSSPPNDRYGFVDGVNRLLDANGLHLRLEDGASARLKVAPSSKLGSIQFGVARGSRGFRKLSFEILDRSGEPVSAPINAL